MPTRWTTSLSALLLVVLAPLVAGQQRPPFKDARERLSYALGIQAGQQFKRRAIDVDPDAFAKGVKDAVVGNTPLLNTDQVDAAIAELQASLKRREFEARTGKAEMTRQAAEAFLAENRKKEGVVTLTSGLQYRIIKAGNGPMPRDADTVECNYRGTLVGGLEFDSSVRGGSSPIIKIDQTIVGLREALKLMPVGSRWEVFVPPNLASGPPLAMVVIPPNQTLIYDVELLAIK